MKDMTNTRLLKMHVKPEARKFKSLTPEQIADIKEMYEMNCTLSTIAEEIGCSISAVWYHVQSPENLRKCRERHRVSHAAWQKKNASYKKLVERYKELHEKGLLE